jgi:peptidoglycan hydrolase-like protein with peptidoglycan-binding domain
MRAIKKGEFSQRVRAIQSMLNVLIGSQLKIDGNFGDNTFNAVRQYQSSRGLTADGIVGINTTNSLINDIDNLIKE